MERLREENLKLSTEAVQLNDTIKAVENQRNEFKSALESEEKFESLRNSVNHLTGMLVSKSSTELTSQQRNSL